MLQQNSMPQQYGMQMTRMQQNGLQVPGQQQNGLQVPNQQPDNMLLALQQQNAMLAAALQQQQQQNAIQAQRQQRNAVAAQARIQPNIPVVEVRDLPRVEPEKAAQKPEDPEETAARLVSIAVKLTTDAGSIQRNGEQDLARRLRERAEKRLQTVVEKYPQTRAADEAKDLLLQWAP
jgi:hypothetical protein